MTKPGHQSGSRRARPPAPDKAPRFSWPPPPEGENLPSLSTRRASAYLEDAEVLDWFARYKGGRGRLTRAALGPERPVQRWIRNLNRIAGMADHRALEIPGEAPDGVQLNDVTMADLVMSRLTAWSIRGIFSSTGAGLVAVDANFVDAEFGKGEGAEGAENAKVVALPGGIGALYTAARCMRAPVETQALRIGGSKSASADVLWSLASGSDLCFERRSRALSVGLARDVSAAKAWVVDEARVKAEGLAAREPSRPTMRVVTLGGVFGHEVAEQVHAETVALIRAAYGPLAPSQHPHAFIFHGLAFRIEDDNTLTSWDRPHVVEITTAEPLVPPDALAAFRSAFDSRRVPRIGVSWGPSARMVRLATPADAPQLTPIAEAAGALKTTAWGVVQDIGNNRRTDDMLPYVIEEGGRTLGFATIDAAAGKLGLVVVGPRRQGHARALCALLFELAFTSGAREIRAAVHSEAGGLLLASLGFPLQASGTVVLRRDRWEAVASARSIAWSQWFR